MEKIATLLGLQKQIRDAVRLEDLGFIAANKTHDLIPYKQCIFWISNSSSSISLKTISGMAKLDENSPYALWLKTLIRKNISSQAEKITAIPRDGDGEWTSNHNYLVVFRDSESGVLGGLWIENDKPLGDPQIELLNEISDCYAHSLSLIKLRQKGKMMASIMGMGRYKKLIIAALVILFFFPVRLSVTAPAEIVARDAVVITMPYDGVLETIDVSPSDNVAEGDIIAMMDKTIIQTELDKTTQALKAAQASLSRAGMESLRSDEKKQDLMELRADIAKKKIDRDYARTRFENTDIIAPVGGVAIFSDKSALEGRALSTGEKIMTIADPSKQEVLIRIPAQSLLPIEDEQPISFYVNTQPFKGYDATISSIGYEASPDPDGLLTYKVRAQLDNNANDLRIGWKGTAKIKSHWSVFGYALLRRPLIAVRNLTGL